jgi:hypothetical protein
LEASDFRRGGIAANGRLVRRTARLNVNVAEI